MFKSIVVASCVLMTSLVMAEHVPVRLMGTVTQTFHIPQTSSLKLRAVPTLEKTISLMAIQLDTTGQEMLFSRFFVSDPEGSIGLPPAKQLGMHGVPVLDQGQHGTCVTFAVTAAYDAVIGKADYISQLCQLALGSYLSRMGYLESGWDGTWGHKILSQMDMFGIVNKDKQQAGACGLLVDYPKYDVPPPDFAMTPENFHAISESLASKTFGWYSILQATEAFEPSVNTQAVLNRVKQALHAGDRVVYGSLLIDADLGVVGAVGRHDLDNDTWVLTAKMKSELQNTQNFLGHEMIITGYDDNAIAVDPDGALHRGLLTVRNSWGNRVGEAGDFYMSYEYFRILVLEAHRILSNRL